MKMATISYTKNNLSALLERVKRGETVTILDRTRPVARLTPIPSTGNNDRDRKLDDMERNGIIRRGVGKIPDWIVKEPPPKAASGFSFADEIRKERDAGP